MSFDISKKPYSSICIWYCIVLFSNLIFFTSTASRNIIFKCLIFTISNSIDSMIAKDTTAAPFIMVIIENNWRRNKTIFIQCFITKGIQVNTKTPQTSPQRSPSSFGGHDGKLEKTGGVK